MTSQKITYDWIAEQNGEGYVQDDNRTFKSTPLADTPYRDVLCHMALRKDNKGSFSVSTNLGSFLGDGSVELNRKAENKVLHFPSVRDIKSKIIKVQEMKLETLYPTFIIERYKLTKNFSYSQKTPIFFDPKTSNFLVFMDEAFLTGITIDEIMPERFENTQIYRHKEKNHNYLAFTAKSIEGLKYVLTNKDKAYQLIKNNYKRHFIKLQESKRVIVVRFETENEDTMTSKFSNQFVIPNYSDNNAVMELMMRQKMDMEIFQAAQIENYFYLMNEDGDINPKAIVYFEDEYTVPNFSENKKSFKTKSGGKTYLIISYTDKDWLFIKNLQHRMHQLCRDLETFFLSTKTEIGLPDKSFSEVPMTGLGNNLLEKK